MKIVGEFLMHVWKLAREESTLDQAANDLGLWALIGPAICRNRWQWATVHDEELAFLGDALYTTRITASESACDEDCFEAESWVGRYRFVAYSAEVFRASHKFVACSSLKEKSSRQSATPVKEQATLNADLGTNNLHRFSCNELLCVF